jgi:uncharacterized protein YkwD
MRGHTSAEKNPPQRKTHSLTEGLSRIMGAFSSREISMRFMPSVLRCAALSLGVVFATSALAADELQLIESINSYRSQPQRCGTQASNELPPLSADPRLRLPASGAVDLQQAMTSAQYPMVNVQAITLNGPRDAAAAMQAIKESFCKVVLDPQFVDIGVNRVDRDWRIVLARPLLTAKLGDAQSEGQKLLAQLNTARGQARQCGGQSFAAAAPLAWNATLGTVAQDHSRDMANNNYLDHKDRDGRTPGDRAELSGYSGQLVGENIAAGQDTVGKVVDGWLASPGHCANLMNPQYQELGAAYATDPKSNAGIYWTAMFGAP